MKTNNIAWEAVLDDYYHNALPLSEILFKHGIKVNALYGKLKKLGMKPRGGAWKLTEEQKKEVWRLFMLGKRRNDIAKRFPVTEAAIGAVIRARKGQK